MIRDWVYFVGSWKFEYYFMMYLLIFFFYFVLSGFVFVGFEEVVEYSVIYWGVFFVVLDDGKCIFEDYFNGGNV